MESTDGAIANAQKLADASTLASKAGSMATQAISTIGNMAAFAAISAIVQFAATKISDWIHRVEIAKEAMQEAVSEYESTKSNLESINSELEQQNQRIHELQSKGHLTYVEKGELEELQKITKELLIQKDIEERKAAADSKKVAETTIDAYKKQYGEDKISQEDLDKKKEILKDNEGAMQHVKENDIAGNIAAYQLATEKQKDRQNAYENAQKKGKDIESYDKALQYSNEQVRKFEDRLDDHIITLQENLLALEEEYQAAKKKELDKDGLNNDEKNAISSYESMDNNLKLLYQARDKNSWNEMEFADIFQTEGIEKTKEELIEMAKSGELTPETLDNFTNLSQAIKESNLILEEGQTYAEAFCEQIQGCAETAEELNDKINVESSTFINTTSQVQSLSEGMNMLDQIYADIADQGNFDWSSILNNEGFQETFGGFTEEYENFIKTISNAPDDIGACQSAFDSLANAYINGSGIMDHLTDETKDMTATMLEQMGVSNAQEMVTAKLAADEAFLAEKKRNAAIASNSLANATWQEISAILSEGNASGIAKSYLTQLALSKLNISEHPIDSRADINSIIAIANAAGASEEYLNTLQTALEKLQNKQKNVEDKKNSTETFGAKKITDIALAVVEKSEAEKEVNSILNNLSNNISENALDPADFYANFGSNAPASTDTSGSSGGGSGVSSDSSLPEAQETMEEAFEETFNWLERRIKNLQRLFDKWLKQAESALTGQFINKYYKKAKKSLKKELNAYDKSYGFYMNKAKETGLDESYAKKIRNGTLDIETVTDQKLAEQIKDYQEWYDKATESASSFLETAEKLYNLPLEKAAAKIELFKDAITLLDKKLSNAIGSAAKNNLLSQKDREEEKTLKAQQKALTESKKNLKKSAKTLKQSGILADSGLTKKQKKKVKKAIKNRQEIDISQFKEGSKAYKAAVKYNNALKAKQTAVYQRDLAKQDLAAWIVESAKLKFDNISDDYEKKIQLINHNISNIDNQISLLTSAGKKVDRSLYESQKSYQMQTLAQYQAQQKALSESLKGIRQGTDEWYDANDKINQLNDSIASCQKQIYEMNNALNQLRFDQFKELAESLERIAAEQDFLQNLFSHEKTIDSETGQFTDAGLAKLGSLSTSLHAAKEKAENDKALLNELLQVKESGEQEDGFYKLGDWEFNSLENLEAKIKETYTTWQGDIKETYSLESSLADLRAEQYKAELDIVKDLIDAKKKALNSEKDLHDYQKSIQEKTDDIAVIQKQIAAYSGDSSQEGLARLQKLQKDLADRQEDLAETEYDRYISDQQDMLDKLYEEYEETITKKIENFDENVQAALKLANDNIAVIADYISKTAEKRGYIIENTDLFAEHTDSLPDSADNPISHTEQTSKPQSQTLHLDLSWAESHPRMVGIDNYASGKKTILQTKNKNSSVKSVKKISDLTQSDFLQEVSNKVPETIAAVMNKDHMLLVPDSTPHPDSTSGRTESNNVVNISTLTLPNVTNYEEFKSKMFHDMQSSRKFENMLNGITVNKLSGNGRLEKYKYKP